jgi:LysM repeat protein
VHTNHIQNNRLFSLQKAILLGAMAFFLVQSVPVHAQASSAMDLINAVNAYRSSVGREPYVVDSSLMSLAQDQSQYQALIQNCTHSRADGSNPGDHGISAENVACGPDLSAQGAITQWSDALHTATMLGPTTGLIGAGVAISDSNVYYTLDVKRLSGDFNYQPPQSSGTSNQQNPTQPAYGLIVLSTPNSDGSIVHIIQYGETLIDIAQAYGISLNDLISLNKLDPKKPVYFAKQPLIIRLAFTETPYMTATYTPRPPTRTPMPTRTQRPTKTATPFRTAVPTRTSTSAPIIQLPTLMELGPARPIMAYAFIAISALGLLVLIYFGFSPNKK